MTTYQEMLSKFYTHAENSDEVELLLTEFFSRDMKADLRTFIEINTLILDCQCDPIKDHPRFTDYMRLQAKVIKFYSLVAGSK